MVAFSEKDIAVIIPTYNRAEDLKITLKSIFAASSSLQEVIIVDQTKDTSTKKMLASLTHKNIRYVHLPTPSLTKARNAGIKALHNRSKIVLFFDDDVTLGKNYFKEILAIFNAYPDAVGVGALASDYTHKKESVLDRMLRRFFLLGHREFGQKSRVLSSYGNTVPLVVTQTIEAQWLSGTNMAYKREVFAHERFDEQLTGYALAEDLDFSYRVYMRNNGGLYLTPATILHRFSAAERLPTRKAAYMNQIHHFYLNFKNFDRNFKEKVSFVWSLAGIAFLRSALALATRKKRDFVSLKLFFESAWFCLTHLSLLRSGTLRRVMEEASRRNVF